MSDILERILAVKREEVAAASAAKPLAEIRDAYWRQVRFHSMGNEPGLRLQELREAYETLTLVQTGKTRRMPIILVHSPFWRGLLDWFRERLVAELCGELATAIEIHPQGVIGFAVCVAVCFGNRPQHVGRAAI